MSNIKFIDAWKDDNNDLIDILSNHVSIRKHINSKKFIDSEKKDVVAYLSNIYNKIQENKNIPNIHNEPSVNMEYLADKVDSIAVGINNISNILKEVLVIDNKVKKSYDNFSALSNSVDRAGEEIRKAVRMLKTKLGYSIITEGEKDRIYQTEDFQLILKKCTDEGGSFEDCMTTSLNEFLKMRGLI